MPTYLGEFIYMGYEVINIVVLANNHDLSLRSRRGVETRHPSELLVGIV